jgi:hypothetical protein
VGGPAKATTVSLVEPCDVAYAAGSVYFADDLVNQDGSGGGWVREVNSRTDLLTTPAGTGLSGPLGLGGPATGSSLVTCGISVDHAGNLVIINGFRVLVTAASTGTFYGKAMTAGDIYPVAGNGKAGFSGDGGPAIKAKLDYPADVAVDGAGNLVIADSGNDRIRVVAASTGSFYGQSMSAGDIYAVAGNGTAGFSGDGGPATAAELDYPSHVEVDGAGNLVIADGNGERVRVVAASTGTFYGQSMTSGNIYTVAGNGIQGYSGDGGPATAAEFSYLQDVAVDGAGNLVIADQYNCRVRVVAASTGTSYGQAMTAGDVYTVAGNGKCKFSGDGGPATAAGLSYPQGVAVDGAGNLVLADLFDSRIRVVAATSGTFYKKAMTAGDIYTIAGNGKYLFSGAGGPATAAELDSPEAVGLGGGTVAIADPGNNTVMAVPATSGTLYGRTVTAGHIYDLAGTGTQGYTGDGGPGGAAKLNNPTGVAIDGAGNLLIADEQNARVRAVAESTGTYYGQAMTAGNIYTIAGNGTQGSSGNGGPATAAELTPYDVAVDSAGNLLIAERAQIRVVAASTGTAYGQTMTAGDIYTIAGNGTQGFSGDGGPAVDAGLDAPSGMTVDRTGNLLFADANNSRIRAVAESTGTYYGQTMTAGDIYTIAGNGTQGFSGDGGPATAAELLVPSSVAVDGTGDLVIADTINNRIRVVAASTGTYYGQAMTAGDIYTIAGNGTAGFSGDGGPASTAELDAPTAVAVDGAGNLVFADSSNNRIRKIAG